MSYKYKTNVTKNRNCECGHKKQNCKTAIKNKDNDKDKYNQTKQNKNNKTDQNNTS